ncbi:MAG: RNA 2'-phosphotransferase [Lachnospiraceae bacterium]|nr:RNA 2'-phosphotransferase [Lachnospiraceae bacterium]
MSDRSTSKYISLILRHKPEKIGITLDEHGWVKVSELIAGVSKTHPLDRERLERIVAEDEKQRYSFNEDKTRIRANQGHSIPVDVELDQVKPPEILYHGTATKYEGAIDREGLKPKSRLYVHLSGDEETAKKVGIRHGKLVLYRIKSGEMHRDGFVFYRSVNGVWLTKAVSMKYMEKITQEKN